MLCWFRGSCGLCHTLGFFCFLGFFGDDCTVGLNLMPFVLPVADVLLFFLFFESKRQPDTEFFSQSCLQLVYCLYQLLDLLDYFGQKKSLVVEV